MKDNYVLMTGAPGSRWSSVANSLMRCVDFDITDKSSDRAYKHHNGLLHSGSYFDPGMEFEFEKDQWDLPFNSYHDQCKKRLIKSHTLATQLENYKKYPIVLVLRNDWECFNWWMECGGFDIQYPNYQWYKNPDNMFSQIQRQNKAINQFIYNNTNKIVKCTTNRGTIKALGLSDYGMSDPAVIDNYNERDICVYVYKSTS